MAKKPLGIIDTSLFSFHLFLNWVKITFLSSIDTFSIFLHNFFFFRRPEKNTKFPKANCIFPCFLQKKIAGRKYQFWPEANIFLLPYISWKETLPKFRHSQKKIHTLWLKNGQKLTWWAYPIRQRIMVNWCISKIS